MSNEAQANDTVRAMNANEDGSVTGYMCLIDWECEIGSASGGNRVFPSIDDLKKSHTCWEGCGIVEVEVRFKRVVVPSRDYDNFDTNKNGRSQPEG